MSQKPKISVLNLTARYGSIDILWANMLRQTEQDFELIIVDALWREREREVKEYINDPRLKYIRQNDKVEGTYTNLAHADNQGFKECTGELIVLLQDYIWIPHNSLEKFWFYHKHFNGKIQITGVGHQYKNPQPVNSDGKITVFEKPYTKRPTDQCWSDPRMRTDFGTFYECNPQDIEFNYCAVPRQMIHDIGGMDEEFDSRGFAWDNVYMAVKGDMLGYKPMIDQTNECMGFDHDGWWPNPLKVNRVSPADYYHEQMNLIRLGKKPIKLNFVSYPDLENNQEKGYNSEE